MKKIILGFTLLSVLFIISCISTNDTSKTEGIRIGKQVENKNLITASEKVLDDCFKRFSIFKNYSSSQFEINSFQFENGENKHFLYADGINSDKKPLKMRIELSLKDNIFIILNKGKGVTAESCTGNKAKFFTKRTGCDCSEAVEEECNHSISTD
jgi:hypothetical protein